MTKEDFTAWIKDELSVSGAIKISGIMPDKEISRIIDNETETLYDIYREAIVEKYTIVPRNIFWMPEFRKTRTLQFPKCVRTVDQVVEMKGRNMMWGISDPDISFSRAFQADLWMSPMGGDTVTFRTIQWQMWDQMKNFITVDMKHSWNPLNHTLLILGHDPQTNVFIHLWEGVKPVDLWENPWVKKWITAKCKKQFAKLLTIVNFTLIGNVTINASVYSQEADTDLKECDDFFKSLIQPDWFVSFP